MIYSNQFHKLSLQRGGKKIRDKQPGSRIQKEQKRRGENNYFVLPFFVAKNFTKFKIILFLKGTTKFE
jgi:hypothetical protein